MPEGFLYIPDFITRTEEDTLLRRFSELTWSEVKLYGVIAKRRVIHFGMQYNYQQRKVNPVSAIPDFLQFLLPRVASIINVNENDIREILLTEYRAGAGIGWHKDAAIFGDKIVGISFENKCTLKLRNPLEDKACVFKQILEPRSAYVISGIARQIWQHHIPAVKERRYSLTFRIL